MKPVDIASILVSLLIICVVLFAFWKHGRGNPESTGHLGRQMRKHGETIAALEERLQGCATRGAVDLLSEQVHNLKASAASSGEVVALESKINGLSSTLSARIDAVKDTAEDTRSGVRRIEAILMRDAISR